MVVSTIYDKELKAKVFQVRDSERYTNSTQTALEVEYVNNRKDYITVNLTAEVKKALGKSSVAFYCDNELLGFDTFNQSDVQATFSAKITYGYHKYYAKYMGNVECLSSKSPVVELEVAEPNLTKTKFSTDVNGVDSNNWASSISNVGITAQLLNYDDDLLDDETVTVTLDGQTSDTITTDNGDIDLSSSVVLNPTLWDNGEHTLKFEYEGDAEKLGCETELKISVGYVVSLTRRYAKLVIGDTEIFDASVTKPDGTPIEGVNVSLKRGS